MSYIDRADAIRATLPIVIQRHGESLITRDIGWLLNELDVTRAELAAARAALGVRRLDGAT